MSRLNIELRSGKITELICDTLILGITEEDTIPAKHVTEIDQILEGQISSLFQNQPWRSKYGKTTVIQPMRKIGAKQILLLGLGNQQKLTEDNIRALSGTAVKTAQELRSNTIAIFLNQTNAVQAIAEGTILGAYQFTYYKTDVIDGDTVKKVILFAEQYDNEQLTRLEQGIVIAASVNRARDLINHPGNILTPTKMAEEASLIAHAHGIDISILERSDMERLKMKALLAVAQGSNEPPKMIILKYYGHRESSEVLGLVGKGITFDSGGISLKPSEGMQDMKDDMAGAAAILGAMEAIAKLKLPINIVAVLPCTENLPSGRALKPGDIISSLEGKTIEIINTDAEGRLVLADGLSYARQLGATKLIDVATLTGACVVALGNITSGVMTTNDAWCDQVLAAAEQAGEKMWKLPLFEEYSEQIKSSIADIKNSGGRPAGAITAGAFLSHFAANVPWVHIDIAGTVTASKEKGYQVKGATGVSVRTLIQLAKNLSTY